MRALATGWLVKPLTEKGKWRRARLGEGARIAQLSVWGSQAFLMVFSSQGCNSDLLARLVSSLLKTGTRLH